MFFEVFVYYDFTTASSGLLSLVGFGWYGYVEMFRARPVAVIHTRMILVIN